MQLNDVLKEFVFEIKIKNYTPKTIKGYRNNNALFFNYLKNKYDITELEEVSHLHIKDYINYLHKKGRSPIYTNTIIKNLRSFFKYCAEEEYILKNPMLKVKWQKEPKTLIKTFYDIEVSQMLDVFNFKDYYNARNKCMLAILFDTGIRNYELCQLTILDVRETVIKIIGKGNKERYVGISPTLKKIMLKYERTREFYFMDKNLQYNNYFLSVRAKPLTTEAVERVVKIAGQEVNVRKEIRCSPHTCRHYFAQAQLKNGLDIYMLARLLGHENISITKRYLQSIQDEDVLSISITTSPLMNLKGGRK